MTTLWSCALIAQLVTAAPAPLTLRQAVAEALVSSPLLGPTTDGAAVAAIQERRARAAFAPEVAPTMRLETTPAGDSQRTMGLDLTQRLASGAAISAGISGRATTVPGQAWDLGYSLQVSQPLLRGFATTGRAPVTQARRDAIGATRALDEARRNLILIVASAYLDAMQTDRILAESSAALGRAERLFQSSRARVAVGLATELDVSRADWLRSQAEAMQLDARDRQSDARDRLTRLIGRPVDAPVVLAPADLSQPATLFDAFVPPVPEGAGDDAGARLSTLVAMALAARPDLQEARDRIDDARRAERIAHWDLLPSLTLNVGYAQAGAVPSSLLAAGVITPATHTLTGWRVGLSSDYSLTRAAASAASATAAVGVRAATRAAEDAEAQVIEEVRRADRDWTRTAAAITLQTQAVAMAERQLRLATLRYERGVAGNFDVTDAENNLFQANTALVAAQAAHALAGLTLRRVVGALDPEVLR